MQTNPPATNRLALLSLLLAMATLGSFCVGLAPIPMTAWVCYPLAVALGSAALWCGLVGLRQVRASGERGRIMALAGIVMGAFSILAVICFTTLTALLLTYGAGWLSRLWPAQ